MRKAIYIILIEVMDDLSLREYDMEFSQLGDGDQQLIFEKMKQEFFGKLEECLESRNWE